MGSYLDHAKAYSTSCLGLTLILLFENTSGQKIYTFLFGCSCFLKQTNNKKLQANTLWLFPINSRADCQRVCDHGRFSQDLSCTSRLWLAVMEILEELVLFIVAHYFHFLSQHLHIFEKNWTLHLGENSSSVFILFKSVCLLY